MKNQVCLNNGIKPYFKDSFLDSLSLFWNVKVQHSNLKDTIHSSRQIQFSFFFVKKVIEYPFCRRFVNVRLHSNISSSVNERVRDLAGDESQAETRSTHSNRTHKGATVAQCHVKTSVRCSSFLTRFFFFSKKRVSSEKSHVLISARGPCFLVRGSWFSTWLSMFSRFYRDFLLICQKFFPWTTYSIDSFWKDLPTIQNILSIFHQQCGILNDHSRTHWRNI